MKQVHDTPLALFENATVFWYEGRKAESTTRYEGKIEVYANWVRFCEPAPQKSWIPREEVEQINEF